VRARAGRLRDLLVGAGVAGDRLELVETVARAGAGALPVTEVPSVAVAAAVPAAEVDARAGLLRRGSPAVVCRVQDGRLLFDLRAVGEDELEDLAAAALLGLI
jgi:L-seryl-tRNA(Ser) seleniumtransferase